ncbi:IS200/IS605 family transposase [Egbenema bharatensis]|uniref:IS200/IS605 family transposase n=1 Tax=Egbenema bharatensis TaxID=3463334 RepID=UPI003A87BF5B
MTVWRTYYHLVWATHDRAPLITEAVEAELYSYIQAKIRSLHCPMHAIGGVADHLHLVVSIPPSQSIADFVKRIKGSSSHHLNRTFPQQTFAWQREYGVFSLGGKQLDRAIAYVNDQKHHHATGNLILGLEPETLDRPTFLHSPHPTRLTQNHPPYPNR